jgi:hypothetical protein
LRGQRVYIRRTSCHFSRTGVDLTPAGDKPYSELKALSPKSSSVSFLLRLHLSINIPLLETVFEEDCDRFLTHVRRRRLRAHRLLQNERSALKQRAARPPHASISNPFLGAGFHKKGTAIWLSCQLPVRKTVWIQLPRLAMSMHFLCHGQSFV